MRETITTEQKGRRSLEKNWTLVASAERDGVGLLGVWRTGGGDWKVKKKGRDERFELVALSRGKKSDKRR
ncbi:hypothetical protein S83_020758, partial [Arachis hypogaea]